MEIGASVTSVMNGQISSNRDGLGIAMLKKAMNTQVAGAIGLLNAIPEPPQAQAGTKGLAANLGNNINTKA